jgi:uncharacterized damage-inducible protein DinB
VISREALWTAAAPATAFVPIRSRGLTHSKRWLAPPQSKALAALARNAAFLQGETMISGRPSDDEFAVYARPDIDYVTGDDAVGALAAQGKEVAALLESLNEETIREHRYAPGKWTVREVIGHLIDDERIFAYRALCVARGDTRPLPGFDENDYVAATGFESRTLASLIDEYRSVRAATLSLFQNLTADEWTRRGNVNGYEASVRGLAFHMAGHELHHLRTLRERYLA